MSMGTHRRPVNNPFASRDGPNRQQAAVRTVGYADHRYGTSNNHNHGHRKAHSRFAKPLCLVITVLVGLVIYATSPSIQSAFTSPLLSTEQGAQSRLRANSNKIKEDDFNSKKDPSSSLRVSDKSNMVKQKPKDESSKFSQSQDLPNPKNVHTNEDEKRSVLPPHNDESLLKEYVNPIIPETPTNNDTDPSLEEISSESTSDDLLGASDDPEEQGPGRNDENEDDDSTSVEPPNDGTKDAYVVSESENLGNYTFDSVNNPFDVDTDIDIFGNSTNATIIDDDISQPVTTGLNDTNEEFSSPLPMSVNVNVKDGSNEIEALPAVNATLSASMISALESKTTTTAFLDNGNGTDAQELNIPGDESLQIISLVGTNTTGTVSSSIVDVESIDDSFNDTNISTMTMDESDTSTLNSTEPLEVSGSSPKEDSLHASESMVNITTKHVNVTNNSTMNATATNRKRKRKKIMVKATNSTLANMTQSESGNKTIHEDSSSRVTNKKGSKSGSNSTSTTTGSRMGGSIIIIPTDEDDPSRASNTSINGSELEKNGTKAVNATNTTDWIRLKGPTTTGQDKNNNTTVTKSEIISSDTTTSSTISPKSDIKLKDKISKEKVIKKTKRDEDDPSRASNTSMNGSELETNGTQAVNATNTTDWIQLKGPTTTGQDKNNNTTDLVSYNLTESDLSSGNTTTSSTISSKSDNKLNDKISKKKATKKTKRR